MLLAISNVTVLSQEDLQSQCYVTSVELLFIYFYSFWILHSFFFYLGERREHLVFHNLTVFHGGFGWHINTSDMSPTNTFLVNTMRIVM